MKVLITSGGTKVPIDTVRHIGNMSSGTFGAKIAFQLLELGHEIIFFKAKGSKHPIISSYNDHLFINEDYYLDQCKKDYENLKKYNSKLKIMEYGNFNEYKSGIEKIIGLSKPDAIVLAAAVSDYGVDNPVDGKIRSTEDQMTIHLSVLPKIISSIREKAPDAFICGFKLLVGSTDVELVGAATKSLIQNDLDLVVANDLRDIKGNNHKLHLVSKEGLEFFQATESAFDHEYLAKKVAERILDHKTKDIK